MANIHSSKDTKEPLRFNNNNNNRHLSIISLLMNKEVFLIRSKMITMMMMMMIMIMMMMMMKMSAMIKILIFCSSNNRPQQLKVKITEKRSLIKISTSSNIILTTLSRNKWESMTKCSKSILQPIINLKLNRSICRQSREIAMEERIRTV